MFDGLAVHEVESIAQIGAGHPVIDTTKTDPDTPGL
jgi:hypothetical protein